MFRKAARSLHVFMNDRTVSCYRTKHCLAVEW